MTKRTKWQRDPLPESSTSAATGTPAAQAPSATQAQQTTHRRASRNGALAFSVVVFALAALIVLAVAWLVAGEIGLLALVLAVVAGALAASSTHIVMEWEKAVVMRFGTFNRVAGPGIVFTWPIIEFYTLRVDQRVSATYFGAEETLTSDLVPLNVDAVAFWMVFSAKAACVEVEDYAQAVSWLAQTTLRKAIGRTTVAEVATRRDQLDVELKEELTEKLNPWGIDVIEVEIRDIVVPKDLQHSMALESIAERERNARIILAEAERDISEMLKDAADAIDGNADAMRLRTMHLAYESVKQSGGTLMVPSAFTEGFVPAAGGAGGSVSGATSAAPAAGGAGGQTPSPDAS